ncbi:uncharacterized protein LOC125073063 isoform X4 [Vanessa atalanta]|uniref:uncharacterized protein LOC125073063 isoform X4 n=1 Tax=Vanessa atalanta TaxID=42275 RepID=UPI001FCCC8A7|nr:uncharacterized protein LOC125073063 isoform X4 [Vanessa atalanta]
MSWMKRQGSAPPPSSEHQAYAASQPYGNQQDMYPNYPGAPPTAQQQQMWQMPQQQPQYNQQYGQVYQQQPFVNNTNQYFQQPQQYNQHYPNQNFDNAQPSYQQNYYQNQMPQPHQQQQQQQQHQQQNFAQNEGNADGWEDNWNWGWEDSSKQHQKPMTQTASTQPALQPPVYNNANVIEESFASTNSWNWSTEEKKDTDLQQTISQPNQDDQEKTVHIDNSNHENNVANEPNIQRRASNISAHSTHDEIKTLNDKELVKEALPNLALGKRFNLENLTPQWSIESQMSQDSSDGPHTQSEGTYRSENQSRNSSKSSPGPNTDTANFNYSQSSFNENVINSEWSNHYTEESKLVGNIQSNSRRESCDELVNSIQDMNIANHENVSLDAQHSSHNVENISDTKQMKAPVPSISPNPMASNQYISQPSMPPPPPVSTQYLSHNISPSISTNNSEQMAPSLPAANITPSSLSSSIAQPPSQPPTISTMPLPPTTNFPTSSSQNPFKNAAPFSHKNISKVPPVNPQPQAYAPPNSNQILTSPAAVSKVVQQDRLSANFGANLETTPDNSERPDQPQVSSYRSMPLPSQVPDNLEIAPQNDRNEYLQTAHLSSVDYGENTDFSRNIPPPGLRRMGVGQQEVEYNQNLNISGDEPPPGLARMVPGQQTETHNSYNQTADDYMDRQIDGQPTDSDRPYRQADGQQMPDTYSQTVTTRGGDRRPVGLDRMVPGEPSNDEYPQYQTQNFASANEQRVVTGVDRDYPISPDAGPTDIREQNVDGSDYTEPPARNPSRSIIGAREASNATSPDFSLSVDDQQREITMEGENLQDLSVVSSVDMSFSREPTYDGSNANTVEPTKDRNHDATDATDYPTNDSRRQSLNRATSGEDSERDRAFKGSPRKDRDKQKSSRDRDRDRDKERGRYSRGERKYERESERRSGRDERRPDKDRRDRDRDRDRDWDRERRDKDGSPEGRRHRRSTRSHRYETEDTDYYSDREKNRRQYREGSYTSSRPPRGDDKERRRHHTLERERHADERARRERPREHSDRRYRDIDPRKYASLRRERDDGDRRKVVTFSGDAKTDETYSSGSRAGSREATATDEEADEPRRRAHRDEWRRHRHHHYYDADRAVSGGAPGAGGAGAWGSALEAQRRHYEYYERLSRTDPAAYMRLYKQLLTPGLYGNLYADGYGQLGYEARTEERGSVHSGRSSANGLKPADTYYGSSRAARDALSLRTDLSDRELTTDMSLNLHLDESTVRSERMTPFKYSTAHVKGVLGARALVLLSAGWPVDGRAPPLQLLPLARLLQRDPAAAALAAYPGPLLRGVTHKKSVVEYCESRVRSARQRDGGDVIGYALLWDLLALMLRQNGVVVGSDVAELLMKNTKEFEYKIPSDKSTEKGGSLSSGCVEAEGEEDGECDLPSMLAEEDAKVKPVVDEKEALERYREYLIYGNRQEALEYAMDCGLWGHALQLAAHGERRARAAVSARFVASLAHRDPLHSLYAALALRAPPLLAVSVHLAPPLAPPLASCDTNVQPAMSPQGAADPRWGDWRPHAAMLLANASARPDHDRRTMTQLGDTLSARGLPYSAQFCYLSAGEPLSPHPLAPLRPTADPAAPVSAPRLSLLLADPRATTLARFATNEAIFATEIYEYALSLGSAQQDHVLDELTVYKLVLATRLADVGQCERALRYAERAARALTRSPRRAPALTLAVAQLADRLKYYDPALQDDAADDAGSAPEDASADASPRHQRWLHELHAVAAQLSAEASQQHTPQHRAEPYAEPYADGTQYAQWDQTLHQTQPIQKYPEPVEDTPDYAAQYYQQQGQLQQHQQFQSQPQPQQLVPESAQEQHHQQPQQQQQQQQQQHYEPQYGYEEQANSYADPYWQPDAHYGYNESAESSRPTITMPGATRAPREDERAESADQVDRDSDSPQSNGKEGRSEGGAKGERRGAGGGAGGGGGGGGWLGGILTKLSLRAPNQMILPDDTNPTIVWDEQHKRWRDMDAADADAPAPPPPPPTGLSTSTPLQSPAALGAPPAMPVSNIFKMQRGRHIKKSYVDVLNPGGARVAAAAPPAPPAPAAPAGPAPAEYFVPAPPAPQVATRPYSDSQLM